MEDTRFPICAGRLLIFEPDECIPIESNADFYLGRDATVWYALNDPQLSRRHLRIHCILFEEEGLSAILPLVYAEDVSSNGTTVIRQASDPSELQHMKLRISRRDNQHSVLLSHGDEIYLTPNIWLAFEQRKGIPDDKLETLSIDSVRQCEQQLFKDRYLVTSRLIGVGGHGKVYIAIHRSSQQQLACKIIDLRRATGASNQDYSDSSTFLLNRGTSPQTNNNTALDHAKGKLTRYFREFDVLRDIRHPNIIRLEKVYWSLNTLYIFQELVTGGDLFSFIESKGGGGASEVETAVIMRQILKAVEYLHERRIVHRDLKPDNILMTSKTIYARVIVTDFDAARFLPQLDQERLAGRMFSTVGTYEFVAPEVHGKNCIVGSEAGYSQAIDMWSVGCITAMLLTGDVVFSNRGHPQYAINPKRVILSMAARCDLAELETGPGWRNVGRRPKDFVKRLVTLDEANRMTAKQALEHIWFTNKWYADKLEVIYDRAIRDWQPGRKVFALVKHLYTNQRSYELG